MHFIKSPRAQLRSSRLVCGWTLCVFTFIFVLSNSTFAIFTQRNVCLGSFVVHYLTSVENSIISWYVYWNFCHWDINMFFLKRNQLISQERLKHGLDLWEERFQVIIFSYCWFYINSENWLAKPLEPAAFLIYTVVVESHFGAQSLESEFHKDGYLKLSWPINVNACFCADLNFTWNLKDSVQYHFSILIFTQKRSHMFDIIYNWSIASMLIIDNYNLLYHFRTLLIQRVVDVLHND